MNTIAGKLRQSSFRGYIHLKIIPGASEAAIQHSLSLASAVSLNIEAAGEKNFNQLCASKSYSRDIIGSIKFISRLTAKGAPYSRVKQTTQFVVGAASDTDEDIVSHTWELYKKLNLNRVYFSAYQRGLGEANLPGERKSCSNSDILMREHRLYQVDWLLRKYGFRAEEVPFDIGGNLSLSIDPKEAWAKRHPEFFPVNVNRAAKEELLRVPGLGEVAVNRIFERRVNGHRLSRIENLGKPGKLLRKASHYISY
jgi:predicted DNA-binding helix-hairpin-helix protein